MATYPFPAPYPTMELCPKCGELKRMHHFRRWIGDKRMLQETCNSCTPEVPLSKLSVAELALAAKAGRITPHEYAHMVDELAKRVGAVREERKDARFAAERSAAWAQCIIDPLRKDARWAYDTGRNKALGEFFQVYEDTLKETIAWLRAALYLPIGPHTADIWRKRTPTEQEMRLAVLSHIGADRMHTLRWLWSQVPVRRGVRMPREPLCLGWRMDGTAD